MQRLRHWRMSYRPPDRSPEEQLEDLFRGLGGFGERLRNIFRGGGGGDGGASGARGGGLGKFLPFILIGVVLAWLATGIYTVQPGQVGVVRQFGRITGQSVEGLHWHIPWPVEQVNVESVTRVRSMELGFRTGQGETAQAFPTESIMIASDETLVDLQLVVQYQVSDPVKFLFNVKDPEGNPGQRTLRDVTESAIRQVVGLRPIDDVLTVGKSVVQARTQVLLQEILDSYGVGITIVNVKLQDVQPPQQVQDAFKDVIAARVDKERLQEEAAAYRNDVVPKAEGRAVEVANNARAFQAERVAEAQGDADKFLSFIAGLAGIDGQEHLASYLDDLEQIRVEFEAAVTDLAPRGESPEDDAVRLAAEEAADMANLAAQKEFIAGLAPLIGTDTYKKARDVTQQRVFLETLERILPKVRKFVVSPDSGGLLQFLPLTDEGQQASSSPQPQSGQGS